jgi:hypothetical protein
MVRFRVPPALFLFFLSPVIGELLSGSAPPSEFFTVFGFTIICLLYGGGALISRELKHRWRKGVGSLILLGAAYGVIEEGLMVASFQNPHHQDLGVLGDFGRYFGVNWVWAVDLTIYHAIVSITVPVLLVELIYPSRKEDPWLRGRWRKIVPALFMGDVIVGFFIFREFNNFTPPIVMYIFFIAVAVTLIALAYKFPEDWARRGNKKLRQPRYYFFITFIGSIILGLLFGVLPEKLGFIGAPIIIALLGPIFLLLLLNHLVSFNWNEASRLHFHRLIFGSLFILIIFSYIQEIDKTRVDDPTGMSLIGTIFLLGFLLLGRYIRAKDVD